MKPPRSIAAVQTVPVPGDVEANVEHHARLVRAAAREGVRTLVFPELSLTGYELELAADLAFSEQDRRLGPLVELASSCGVTLVVGAPVRIGSGLHIGAFVLTPEGAIELYTKHHVGAGEETVFQPGERDPLVRCGEGTAALAVRADVSHASHPARAAERGATTYLVGMFITPSEVPAKSAKLAAYAARHSLTVVFANFGGPSGGQDSGGGSAIWSREGELLARLDRKGAGLVFAVEDDGGWRAGTVVLDGP